MGQEEDRLDSHGMVFIVPIALIVAYYFPPRQHIASRRMEGLAKYLPEFGWEPVILTAALPSGPRPAVEILETDYEDVLAGWVKRLALGVSDRLQAKPADSSKSYVKHALRRRLIRLGMEIFAYPDPQRKWHTYALEAGASYLERHHERVDVIISSSDPFTAHLVARQLKQKFGLPWLADLRDLWTQNHYYPFGRIRRALERRLERTTLGDADIVVTVSEPLTDKLRQLHGDAPIHAIPNGFDPEEWSCEAHPLTEKFTITHTGQLYEGKRDPAALLETIRYLIDSHAMTPESVEMRFFGPYSPWLERLARKYNLSSVVNQYGVVPRQEAVERQRESHLLLLLTWDDPDERGVYTGKVFEYLAARRPIIALGQHGSVVDNLLAETRAGKLVSPRNGQDLRAMISKAYSNYMAGRRIPYEGGEQAIMRYSHREMARQFAELLNAVRSR